MTTLLGMVDFLKYGAIGFGLASAILLYRLLGREATRDKPRRRILTAIYGFMLFAVVLAGAGFALEYQRLNRGQLEHEKTQLLDESARLRKELGGITTDLEKTRQSLTSLRFKPWRWAAKAVGMDVYQCRVDDTDAGDRFNCRETSFAGIYLCGLEEAKVQLRTAYCAVKVGKP